MIRAALLASGTEIGRSPLSKLLAHRRWLVLDRLVRDEDRAGVREVCVEIFRLRATHAWPPRITVLPDWPEGYRMLAEQLVFAPADVHQAAIDVQEIIARIDAGGCPDRRGTLGAASGV